MSLDGLSLSLLVSELNIALHGGRIEKVFQPDSYSLVLWIRIPGKTVRLVLSANPSHPRMNISADNLENPDTPPAFCMLLRKHLEDGRIHSIVQHSLDRIVMINIDVREEGGAIAGKTLIIELMGKHSNIIFAQNGSILDAIRRVSPTMSRYRQVLPGRPYTLPPGQERINLLEVSANSFVHTLREQAGNIQKAIIQSAIGLGPLSAKELLWRSAIAFDASISDLDDLSWMRLENSIETIMTPIKLTLAVPHVRINLANKVTGFAGFRLNHLTDPAHEFNTMSEAVDFISSLSPQTSPDKEKLHKFLSNELNRLTRKREILSEELVQANAADDLRRCADIIMTYLPNLAQGQETVDLPDIYAEEPNVSHLRIELDPKITPLQNAQSYYSRYNKQKRAQQILSQQLAQLDQETQYLDSVLHMLEQAQNTQEVKEIEQELIAGGYLQKSKKKKPEPVSAPLTIRLQDGSSITVGKNNRQNDLVTFKYARPDDLWFHTKDIPGSHVILRSQGVPDIQTLHITAMIAAYFSKARQSSNVPVDYTLRRQVKKPNGAKPGFVIYDKQTTVFVTPEKSIIQELMKNNS